MAKKNKPKNKQISKVQAKPKQSNRAIAIVVIVAAIVVLISYMFSQSPTSNSNNSANQAQSNQTQETLPPMQGVESYNIENLSSAKLKTTTFKMAELSGTDCVQTILDQFKATGGIAKVRADYSNKLLELQYDANKYTEANIVDKLIKSQHSGSVTSEKIK